MEGRATRLAGGRRRGAKGSTGTAARQDVVCTPTGPGSFLPTPEGRGGEEGCWQEKRVLKPFLPPCNLPPPKPPLTPPPRRGGRLGGIGIGKRLVAGCQLASGLDPPPPGGVGCWDALGLTKKACGAHGPGGEQAEGADVGRAWNVAHEVKRIAGEGGGLTGIDEHKQEGGGERSGISPPPSFKIFIWVLSIEHWALIPPFGPLYVCPRVSS